MCKQLTGIPQQSAHETRAARAESKREREREMKTGEKEIKRQSVRGKKNLYSPVVWFGDVHTGTKALSVPVVSCRYLIKDGCRVETRRDRSHLNLCLRRYCTAHRSIFRFSLEDAI